MEQTDWIFAMVCGTRVEQGDSELEMSNKQGVIFPADAKALPAGNLEAHRKFESKITGLPITEGNFLSQ